MIHLRDFRTGRPEAERHTLCGAAAAEVPTTSSNLEWWRARSKVCHLCWDAWRGAMEKVMGLRP